MKEKIEVKAYMINEICHKCGKGYMIYETDGNAFLAVYPPRFTHRCDRCGNIETYLEQYPKIEYEPIQNS